MSALTCLKCVSLLDRLLRNSYSVAMEQTNDTSLPDAGNPTDTGIPSGNSDGIAIDPRVARTRRAIWQASLDLAREEGFHAVSVAQVARRAGINRSTFYAHFPDKHAVVRAELARLLRDLRAGQQQPTPESMARFDPQTPHPNALRWFAHVAAHEGFYSAVLVTGELAASGPWSRGLSAVNCAFCQFIPAVEAAMARKVAMVSWSLSSNIGSVLVLTITTSRMGST